MPSHAVKAKAVFQQGTLLHEIDGETACCKGLQTNNHTVKKDINRKKQMSYPSQGRTSENFRHTTASFSTSPTNTIFLQRDAKY